MPYLGALAICFALIVIGAVIACEILLYDRHDP